MGTGRARGEEVKGFASKMWEERDAALAAFAVAFVLNRYLSNDGYLYIVVRPLLALVAVAILVQLVLSLVTRNRFRSTRIVGKEFAARVR